MPTSSQDAHSNPTNHTQQNPKISAIILAAGKGTRMNTPLAKVLHPVAGIPMVHRVIQAVQRAGAQDVRLVVGHNSQLVKTVVQSLGVNCFEQLKQQGTADAVKSADIESLEGTVLIVNGDHPLIRGDDLIHLLQKFTEEKAEIAVVTAEVKEPGSFGRVVRHHGQIHSIVEAKDASHETLKINEINTGLYLAKAEALKDLLPQIKNQNAQQEYYLTDIISLGLQEGYRVTALKGPAHVAVGVNTQSELAKATRLVFQQKAKELMDDGVIILDPKTTYIEDTVCVGPATVIYPGVYLRGSTDVGSFCSLEPNCYVVDCDIDDSVQIKAGSYLESSKISNNASVGPYARLRPGTEIGEKAHIGNFVEFKKVKFGKGSKAGHLTYLGDADIGEEVNIGCGTITCNYAVDKKKYKTKIGHRVFVGSDSQFVAPVEVGDDAVIGSGSTITKDVPARALAVARSRQIVKEDYVKNDKGDAPCAE